MVVIGNSFPVINGSAKMTANLISTLKERFNVYEYNTTISNSISDIGKAKAYKILKIIVVFTKLLFLKRSDTYFIVLNFNIGNSWKLIPIFFNLLFNLRSCSKIIIWPHIMLEGQKIFIFRIFNYFFNCKIVCLGISEKKKFLNLGFNTHVIFNFVETNLTLNNKIQNKSQKKILFFSNLLKFKGIEDFIEIVARLSNKGNKFDVVILGNEADYTCTQLQCIFDQILNDNISFQIITNCNGIEKFNLIKDCDLLLYPSKYDYSPLAVLECMSLGLPVISYDIGELKNMISSQGAIAHSLEDFTNITESWLSNSNIFSNADLNNYSHESFKNSVYNLCKF